MKYFLELVEDLKKGRTAQVYLFFGPEDYLRREAAKKIRDTLFPDGADDFNQVTLDAGETTASEIVSLALMTPLFAQKRLIMVKNAGFFSQGKSSADSGEEAGKEPPRKDEVLLLKYFAAPNPDTCLVFDAGENVDRRKKIFKEITKAGKAIEFSLLKPDELTRWLDKQARLAGKSLAPGTAAEIIARAGNTLEALSQEINKLIAYAGENGTITPGDVASATPPHPEEDVFAVVDAIGERNAKRAIEGVNRLVLQKHPPPVILAMVARQIRLILRMGEAVRSGLSQAEHAHRLGIHPFVAKKVLSQQKNFDRKQLIRSLSSLHHLDVAVKSGREDFLPGMEAFVIDICKR
ncbi:MAG: DNA polymerase III subunit delta [Bacillota bacterium]